MYLYIDCGSPLAARGVTIKAYNSTTIGSEVSFHCMDGLIPNEEVIAICQLSGHWIPDPEMYVCGTNNSGIYTTLQS